MHSFGRTRNQSNDKQKKNKNNSTQDCLCTYRDDRRMMAFEYRVDMSALLPQNTRIIQ